MHMEQGENYNILAIRGKVEKGLVTYGAAVPAFSDIKGELELRGKDFLLHRMTGQFGQSPFSLDGKIADYPLDKPSSYPFDMTITPRQPELAWLLGKEAGRKSCVCRRFEVTTSGRGLTPAVTTLQANGILPLQLTAISDLAHVNRPAGRTFSPSRVRSTSRRRGLPRSSTTWRRWRWRSVAIIVSQDVND